MNKKVLANALGFTIILASCGNSANFSSSDKQKQDSAETAGRLSDDADNARDQLAISNVFEIYIISSQVLHQKIQFPLGAVIEYNPNAQSENYDYVDSRGERRRSSTGFHKINLVNVPQEALPEFPLARIREINATPGGLFVFSSQLMEEIAREVITPLLPSKPQEEFLQNYSEAGRPNFSFSVQFRERFGTQLNRAIPRSSQSSAEQSKWSSIMLELGRAVDRTRSTQGQMMFVSQANAKSFSELFEEKGIIQNIGAWSIAVTGTARRHGFENVPCAEFVSEVLRQAYKRAGYDVTNDFNVSRGNALIWTNTAAVVNLANALAKAGWIPWETVTFKPQIGVPMMHYLARSPGHAYFIGGDEGRIIVDNGSPRGRDLRRTSKKITDMMFKHGVFFLPPGMTPARW